MKNLVLLLVSLVFYGWGEPGYLLLMALTVALNFCAGLLMARRPSRWLLWTAVGADLALLGFFKYYDLLAGTVGAPLLAIALPVGISFYTFQALSYVVDVYRGEEALRDPIAFGTYITMFPQLVAGPIVRYSQVKNDLYDRTVTLPRAAAGALRFLCGLGKKVLLANGAGEMFRHFAGLAGNGLGTVGAWLGIVCYTFQIYFDFSAYSDMAVGLGHILGFSFPENFRYPYCALDIRDFWRRWHISLSTWFREYVYIPLGGNRHGTGRTLGNLLTVWALTGLWHGASWNFLFWGLYYFLLLAAERLFLGRLLERTPRPLRRVYTLFFVMVGWVLFAGTETNAAAYLGAMLGIGAPLVGEGDLYHLGRQALPLLIMALGATPLPRRLWYRFLEGRPRRRLLTLPSALLLLFLCTAYLAGASYNPFLYFRF